MNNDKSPTRHRDAGLSMMEILVSMVIAGTLVSALTLAYSTILRTHPDTVNRVAVSKDVSFIQAWLPLDLASAIDVDMTPTLQPATSKPLPGTNVLTITRKDLQSPGHPEYFVNYRYAQVDGRWVLLRFEIRNVGGVPGPEEVTQVGVAHELVPPPPGWDPTTPPTFAIDVSGRNPGQLHMVGSDVTVNFADGSGYDTGGAGLGSGFVLPPIPADGFLNPASPPSRCGGKMTLLLDTSSSLSSELPIVKSAAKDFVDAFRGTPTELRVTEFDREGKPVAPSTWNGPAIDMLNIDNAGVAAVKQDIDDIDDSTGGTNWEDGLRLAMTDFSDRVAINPSPHLPDTVVFFTDGEPYRYVDSSGNIQSTNKDHATAEAKTVSNEKGEWGVTLKGVFVHRPSLTGSALEAAKDRMKQIVGSTEWVPGPSGGVGNAQTASFFYTSDFLELSNIFQQIFVSDCGGTITVQRRENNDPNDKVTSGSYEYATTTGNATLNASISSSITFDYNLAAGASEWVTMVEEGATGAEITDVQCFSNGTDVTATRVQTLYENDGVTVIPSGRSIKVVANEALSCLFIGS
ncbi:MAG: VWA domain-containing protein [Ilumatobacter sp.]|nr:VWA domain-containing protein [Ilumatobacter sp.]